MTQNKSMDLSKMDLLQVLNHERALLSSDKSLLTPEEEEKIAEELQRAIHEKSARVDMIYSYLINNEDCLERVKKEEELLKNAKKSYKNKIDRLEGLLRYIGRMLPVGKNSLTGYKYKFLLSKKATSSVRIDSNPEDWTPEQQQKFLTKTEVETTTKTVVRSIQGEVLDESTSTDSQVKITPNKDAIRNANKSNERLPEGVYVYPTIAILRRRADGVSCSLELEASQYSNHIFPKTSTTEES